MKLNRIFFLVLFLLIGSFSFAVSYPLFQSSNRTLEDAHSAFDSKDYGAALRLAEEAKIIRRQEVSECLEILDQALKPFAVRSAGDLITDVRSVLLKRDVFDAVELIDYLISIKGEKYFEGFISNMRAFIESKNIFPETGYLIARVYELEGEYDLAYSYFMDSWEHSDVLDIPDVKYDILYDMANLSYNFNHKDECEKALLLVLSSDPYFSDNAFMKSLKSSVARGYSADKLFGLFRTDCYRSLPAFYRLVELYVEQGREEEAFSIALIGVLTAFTRMNTIYTDRTNDFQYTTLTDFFDVVMKQSDITDWSVKTGFWKCLYTLADLGVKLYPENNSFGKALLSIIATESPDDYWKKLALVQSF